MDSSCTPVASADVGVEAVGGGAGNRRTPGVVVWPEMKPVTE